MTIMIIIIIVIIIPIYVMIIIIISGCGHICGVRVVDSPGLSSHPHPGPPDPLLQVWVGQRKVKLVKMINNEKLCRCCCISIKKH